MRSRGFPSLRRASCRRRQRGVELIEFTLLLPFVLLLLFGILELSIAFWDQAILTNAARAAVREAARAQDCGWTTAYASQQAQAAASDATQRLFSLTSPQTMQFSCPPPSGQFWTCTLTYPYSFKVLPNFLSGLADLQLTATATMRQLPNLCN